MVSLSKKVNMQKKFYYGFRVHIKFTPYKTMPHLQRSTRGRAGEGSKGRRGQKRQKGLDGRRKGWLECVSKNVNLKAPLDEHQTSAVNSV